MNKQQKEILQSQLDNEKKTISELKQVYMQALKDVSQKISELSARADMEPQLLQSIIYQKQYQEAIKAQIEGVLVQMDSNAYATISEYLANCYQEGYVGVMYDVAAQGIPFVIPINPEDVHKAIQLDSKLSKGLYSRLGEDVSELKKAVRTEVSRGIVSGSSWNQIANNLATNFKNTPFNKAYNNSIRITRTEGHRIQNQAALDAQEQAKKKGADIVKQWDSTLDGNTRPSHRKLDGQIREVDEDFEVDGMTASAPGMFGDPGEDCNCRCCLLQRAKWALDESELETLKERAEYFGLDKTKDFDDFKEKYLKVSQQEAVNVQMTSKGTSQEKALEKVGKSSTIKSLDIDDFNLMISGKNVSKDVSDVITGTIKEFEKKGGMYISEAHFGEYYDSNTNKPALFQIFVNPNGLVDINVNTSLLGGKSLEEINKMIESTSSNLPKNLQEAIAHECGHAKAYYKKTAKEVEEMNNALEKLGIPGISLDAARDGAECIAEVEVLLYRGEDVPEEAMKLYRKYVKG